MNLVQIFLGNMYTFTVYPFQALSEAVMGKRTNGCGLGALAGVVAIAGIMMMVLGALGGFLLGYPPYLTFLFFPVVASLLGAIFMRTTF